MYNISLSVLYYYKYKGRPALEGLPSFKGHNLKGVGLKIRGGPQDQGLTCVKYKSFLH
jgi:hypothetical protein